MTRVSRAVAVVAVLAVAAIASAASTLAAPGASASASRTPTASVPYGTGTLCGSSSSGAASCLAIGGSAGRPVAAPSSAASESDSHLWLTPDAIQNLYQIPRTATPATIAIVDAYAYPTAEADLSAYRSYFGLPACTTVSGCLTIVGQDGSGTPDAPDAASPEYQSMIEWDGEQSLDVDMVSAACPSCHILLVQSTSNSMSDMVAAVRTAGALGARYVSMSWGAPASGMTTELDAQAAWRSDTVYLAASGDAGFGQGWPSSSEAVVVVGGTSVDSSGLTSAWDWAGSGCIPGAQPYWQADAVGRVCSGRAYSDVSAAADPADGGAYVYLDGAWRVIGGTSEATPIVAALYAIAGKGKGVPSGSLPPAAWPYAHAILSPHDSGLTDITTGATGDLDSQLYRAATGWDGPTGLGTPRGISALTPVSASDWPRPAATPSTTPDPAPTMTVVEHDTTHVTRLVPGPTVTAAPLTVTRTETVTRTVSVPGPTATETVVAGPEPSTAVAQAAEERTIPTSTDTIWLATVTALCGLALLIGVLAHVRYHRKDRP